MQGSFFECCLSTINLIPLWYYCRLIKDIMAKNGPILILNDDADDIDILEQAFKNKQVPNQRYYFRDGRELLHYLRTTEEQPFIIISDVKLAGMDGFEVREMIQQDDYLIKKGIPFIYFSIDARKSTIERAYKLTVQGFFEKENTIPGIEDQLGKILNYWDTCKHPNS